jgi:hypothetical protein
MEGRRTQSLLRIRETQIRELVLLRLKSKSVNAFCALLAGGLLTLAGCGGAPAWTLVRAPPGGFLSFYVPQAPAWHRTTLSPCRQPCHPDVATITTPQWTVVERRSTAMQAAAFGSPRWRYDARRGEVSETFTVARLPQHYIVTVALQGVTYRKLSASKGEVRAMVGYHGQWPLILPEGISNY